MPEQTKNLKRKTKNDEVVSARAIMEDARGEGTQPGASGAEARTKTAGTAASTPRPGGHGPGPRVGGEQAKDFKGTLKRLLKDLLTHRWLLLLLLVFSFIGGVIGSQGPKYVGDATQVLFEGLVTKNLPEGITSAQLSQYLEANGQGALTNMVGSLDLSHRGVDWSQFYLLIFIVIGIYVTVFFSRWLAALMAQKTIAKFSKSLRERIQNKIFELPLKYLDTHSTGDILSRTTNDVDNIVGNMTQILSELIVSVIMVVSIIVMMFIVAWNLAIIALLSVILSMLILRLIAKHAQPHFNAQWKITGNLNGHIEEYFTGHSIVALFNKKADAISEFEVMNQKLFERTFKAQMWSSLIQPITNLVTNLNYVILASVGAFGVIGGWMTLGAVQSTIMYSRGYSQPLGQIGGMMNQLQSSLASLERVYELLDVENEPTTRVKAELGDHVQGKVDFDHIDFSYEPNQHLIENLSLKVEPGKTIAIVGKTGAGKTTLVNLIMRFYDVTAGDIKVDDLSIYDLARADLRRNVGMVLQQTWLFSGTIRENLLYGVRDGETISDQQFYDIAKATNVDQFVSQLAEGYETKIDDSNSQISEGQRQLLTICRAFMSDPEIIILDEATSSVDTRTEILVQQAMNRLRQNRTAFIIAHRLSTIQNADTILVMDQGNIVEQGSHAELIQTGGFYASLFHSQYSNTSK
ncbi:MAG: ABC transporter ATP-binding protein/permease [Bifidobacteriaceae bacterium]|jgi:ATP-binding cassette subfamily B protein|nr:ABC transporter ATP-binding protein/permease [Bifidobacteriaceae bacterium]